MTEETFKIPEEVQKLSAAYNTYRLKYQNKKLSASEAGEIFKAIGFGSHSIFRKYALKNKLLIKHGTSRDCYFYFPNEPVLWKNVEKTLSEAREEMRHAKSSCKISISDAIALLKEHGYKVLKPTFVEILLFLLLSYFILGRDVKVSPLFYFNYET